MIVNSTKMRTLIDLTKDKDRVFIVLKTPHAKAEFLKKATDEGFVIGNKLPINCEHESIILVC